MDDYIEQQKTIARLEREIKILEASTLPSLVNAYRDIYIKQVPK